MAATILTIPAEILLKIAYLLDLDDIIRLRNASKGLFHALDGETFSQQVAMQHFACSRETQLAKQGTISYSTAVRRIFWRRKALALAQPHSVVVLARDGGDRQYRDGFLSYVHGNTIRVLDVYNASMTENVIDLKDLLDQEADRWPPEVGDLRKIRDNLATGKPDCYRPMVNHYHDGMISVFFTKDKYHVCAIIDARKDVPSSHRRVRLMFSFHGLHPQSRFTKRHLFLTANRNLLRDSRRNRRRYGVDRWVVWCFDLEVPETPPSMLHLEGFSGSELFRTADPCTFELYDGWFYALCLADIARNGNKNEAFYNCYRIPTDGSYSQPSLGDGTGPSTPEKDFLFVPEMVRIPRPFHGTRVKMEVEELQLTRDEQTGTLIIVEGREELSWGFEVIRSCYYFQPLVFPAPPAGAVVSDCAKFASVVTIGSEDDVADDIPPHPYPSYYRYKQTVIRRYVQPSSAFVVTIFGSDTPNQSIFQQKFRLCVGSWLFTPPIDSQDGLSLESTSTGEEILPVPYHESRFTKSLMRRIPPQNAPKELTGLLNPFPNFRGWVDSTTDERSVVVLYGEGDLWRCRATGLEVLLINFDPWARFPGLNRIILDPISDLVSYGDHQKEVRELFDIFCERTEEETGTRGPDHPSDEAGPSGSQEQISQEMIDTTTTSDRQGAEHGGNGSKKEREAPDSGREDENALVLGSADGSTSAPGEADEQKVTNGLATGSSASQQRPREYDGDPAPKTHAQTPKDRNLNDENDGSVADAEALENTAINASSADAEGLENKDGTDTWFRTEEALCVGINKGYRFY